MGEAVSRAAFAARSISIGPGRQAGYLRAPLSRNTSGWGMVEIPIIVREERLGPDGPVHRRRAWRRIRRARSPSRAWRSALDPAQIQGRVIMMPAVNIPAVLNDTRLSPVDDRDLNRCFPGNPRGTFSEMLAHFVDSVILPHVRRLGRPAHGRPFGGIGALDQHALSAGCRDARRRPWRRRRPSARPSTSCSGASTKARP